LPTVCEKFFGLAFVKVTPCKKKISFKNFICVNYVISQHYSSKSLEKKKKEDKKMMTTLPLLFDLSFYTFFA